MGDEKSAKWGWIYYGSTICLGTVASMAVKAMSTETAPIPGTHPEFRDYFQHPYMLTFCMFIGEVLCLPIFYLNRAIFPTSDQKSAQKRINPLLCAIPALCDTVVSALIYNAYNLAAVSMVQMTTGIRIIATAILARLYLKNPLHRHHIIGLTLIFIGLFFVGLAAYSDTSGSSSPLGILFLIIGYIISPIQFVIEEALFRNYTLHPLEIISYEGGAGCVFSAIILIIFQQIPCERVRQTGDYDTYPQTAHCPYGRMEESTIGIYQLLNDNKMLLLMIIVIISLAVFNFSGQGVTKHLSSTARTTVSVIQTAVVWLISISLGWEGFLLLQLIGFIIGTIGTIIYNEIYVPSIFGFDKNTKANKAKRDETDGSALVKAE